MHDKKIAKIVYFVRHGESEGNIASFYQSVDSSLTQRGRAQVKRIAERVAKLSFDVLLASPQMRAKETAEAVAAATGKHIEYSDLFVERIKPSKLSGKPHGDAYADSLNEKWEKSLFTSGFRAEDGENYDDLITRAGRALDFLAKRTEYSIVVATHGFFLRTLVARVLLGEAISDKSFHQFQKSIMTENTGLTVLRLQTGRESGLYWRLWIFNDHAHLG